MTPPSRSSLDETVARIVKASIGGTADSIAILNQSLQALTQTIGHQQTLLAEANNTVQRLTTDNAELRAASTERDRIMKSLDIELEKVRLADRRKGEMLQLCKVLGAQALQYIQGVRALPPPSSQPQPASESNPYE